MPIACGSKNFKKTLPQVFFFKLPQAMLVFAWQVQHFNALSLVAVLARFCFQSLAAVKKYRLWRCVGVLDARVYYKKPIACGSTLLRLMHSRMQGRSYEEGSDMAHVPSCDAFHATFRLLLQT